MDTQIKNNYIAIRDKLAKDSFGGNSMAVPRLVKVVINSGIGKGDKDPTLQDDVVKILESISGQKPVLTKARKSISNFSVRLGMPIGVMVTLRGNQMWNFIEKFISLVLPRVRDFRGLKKRNIDQSGNLNVGILEHRVFLEIDPNDMSKNRSMQITFVTDNCEQDVAYKIFEGMGFPFID